MTNNLVGNGGKTYSSNSKLVESARCCLLWQLILFQVVIKPSSYLIFKVYKTHAYLVHGSSFGRNVLWRNFIELPGNHLLYQIIKVYLSLLKYSFCTKYIYLDHSVGINSSKENLWIIYHLPCISKYHEVVEYHVFYAIHDRIIKPFCSHTSL